MQEYRRLPVRHNFLHDRRTHAQAIEKIWLVRLWDELTHMGPHMGLRETQYTIYDFGVITASAMRKTHIGNYV